MDVFLTFTCNMKKHFGTRIVKEWIDSEEWTQHIDEFNELDCFEQEELRNGIKQASGNLLQRVWMEVCELFLNYLKNSPTSPYRSVNSIFARHEFQKGE